MVKCWNCGKEVSDIRPQIKGIGVCFSCGDKVKEEDIKYAIEYKKEIEELIEKELQNYERYSLSALNLNEIYKRKWYFQAEISDSYAMKTIYLDFRYNQEEQEIEINVYEDIYEKVRYYDTSIKNFWMVLKD